ncbi:hypothetical protein [Scytonema sp. NUACC26]|uniref:hypothetical protein n=1 Tax=Scytonema sp. NUACC26 TaxID=3140176 RepID=UPI0038B2A765
MEQLFAAGVPVDLANRQVVIALITSYKARPVKAPAAVNGTVLTLKPLPFANIPILPMEAPATPPAPASTTALSVSIPHSE